MTRRTVVAGRRAGHALSANPEYVSGHRATGAAAATVLGHWFGDDNAFAVTSETLVGAAYTRRFTSFSDAAKENALSRIYGGIHYRFSNEAGLTLGRKVADYVLASDLKAFPEVGGEGGAGGSTTGGDSAGGPAEGGSAEEPAAGAPSTTGGTGGVAGASTSAGSAGSAGTVTTPVSEGGEPASGGAPSSAGANSGGKATGGSKAQAGGGDDSGCSISANSSSDGSAGLLVLIGLAAALRRRRVRAR